MQPRGEQAFRIRSPFLSGEFRFRHGRTDPKPNATECMSSMAVAVEPTEMPRCFAVALTISIASLSWPFALSPKVVLLLERRPKGHRKCRASRPRAYSTAIHDAMPDDCRPPRRVLTATGVPDPPTSSSSPILSRPLLKISMTKLVPSLALQSAKQYRFEPLAGSSSSSFLAALYPHRKSPYASILFSASSSAPKTTVIDIGCDTSTSWKSASVKAAIRLAPRHRSIASSTDVLPESPGPIRQLILG